MATWYAISPRLARSAHPQKQWVTIDSKVYDLSKFAKMHPGGLSVLLDEDVGTH
jgi:cytochrome b involved in lipid metabolism